MNKHDIGVKGEDIALAHLLAKGHTLLTRNWKCRMGELDLVTRQRDILIFVEVKACSGRGLDAAIMNMTPRKIERLTKAIHYYLDAHNISEPLWQLDFVAVAIPYSGAPLVEHWENALEW